MRRQKFSFINSFWLLIAFIALPLVMTSSGTFAQSKPAQAEPEDEIVIEPAKVPTFVGAYLSGQVAQFDRDIDRAIAFYQRALELEPENIDAKRRLFSSLIISGDFDRAVTLATELNDDVDVAELSDRTLAIESIRKREYRNTDRFINLEEAHPVDSLVNSLLSAWAKFGEGNGEEALADIEKLTGPIWYTQFKDYNMGIMAAAMGNKELAIERLDALIDNQEAIQITPDTYIEGIMSLAILHAQNGDIDLSLRALEGNGNIQSAYPPAVALQEKIMAKQDLVFPVTNAQQGAAAALFTIGAALNSDGNEESVALYLQFSRALDPENAAALIMLAGVHEQFEQPNKAIEIYRSVPKDSYMYRLSELQLGLNLADIGKAEEAMDHIRSLIEENPTNIRAYVSLGRILSLDKKYQDVVDNFEGAIKALGPIYNRSHWNLFYQLGIAYERLKVWDKAEAAFLRALELSPNQPQVMNYLGYSWIDMNINLERGMELIRAAVDLRPNDGYIVDSLGWAHYRQGQYEAAVRELERAVLLRPSDPTINDHLGDAFWRVGRKTEAYFQWERALATMAEFDESLVPAIEKKLKEGLPDEETPSTDG